MIFKFRLPMLALYFSSVTAFMLMPLFKFKRVDAKNLYGVDILIQRLRDVHAIDVFLYAVITIFIAVLLLGLVHAAKELFISLFLLSGTAFFGLYTYYYFIETVMYYIPFIKALLMSYDIFSVVFFSLMLLFTVAFYVGGFTAFVYHLLKDFRTRFL